MSSPASSMSPSQNETSVAVTSNGTTGSPLSIVIPPVTVTVPPPKALSTNPEIPSDPRTSGFKQFSGSEFNSRIINNVKNGNSVRGWGLPNNLYAELLEPHQERDGDKKGTTLYKYFDILKAKAKQIGAEDGFKMCKYVAKKYGQLIANITPWFTSTEGEGVSKKKSESWLKIYDLYRDFLSDVLTNTTKTDETTKKTYETFLQEIFDFMRDYHKEIIAGNTAIVNDPNIQAAFNSREFAFLKYINDFVLPKELSKYDANVDINVLSLRSSLSIPQLKRESNVSGFSIPVNFRVSLNNPDQRMAVLEHGNININLRAVEENIAESEVKVEIWEGQFNNLFKQNSEFSFSQKPAFLAPYLDVCSHKLLSKGTNKGQDVQKFRDKYLENLLAETVHTASGIFFNEARAHKFYSDQADGIFDFWGSRLGGMAKMLEEGVFREDASSTIKKDVLTAVASCEEKNLNLQLYSILNELYRVEAKLRAIPEQNNPLATLYSSLRGIVIPNSGLDTAQPKFSDAKYRYLSEVLTTKLLTEAFLPGGKELSAQINWNELMKVNFGNEGTSQFTGSWDAYLRSNKPEPGSDGDPNGLMALRAAWYKFFDDNLGRFDKATNYNFDSLKAIAKRTFEREFMSYKNRNKINLGTPDKFQGWQEYYKQHLAI